MENTGQENNNIGLTSGMLQTQNAVEFINKKVLQPEIKYPKGTAGPMVDQALGMMMQDLQSFTKGFEQIALVALTKVANNYMTCGNYNCPPGLKPGDDILIGNKEAKHINDNAEPIITNPDLIGGTGGVKTAVNIKSCDGIKSLFNIVGDYGLMKAKIASSLNNIHRDYNNDPIIIPDNSNDSSISKQQEETEDLKKTKEKQKKKTFWFPKNKQ